MAMTKGIKEPKISRSCTATDEVIRAEQECRCHNCRVTKVISMEPPSTKGKITQKYEHVIPVKMGHKKASTSVRN
jgi:hypothetical protein